MNTRIQVEHCVTELTTGMDIVREQVRIAAGEQLSVTQEDVQIRGHAIECRINAEDASKRFAPAPGRVESYREPAGPGVRVDSGAEAGYEVLPLYDPMIAKLIVWDEDRESATRRMLRALGEFEIGGVRTLDPLPPGAAGDPAVGEWRDLPRPRGGPGVAERAGAAGSAAGTEEDEAPKQERDYAVEVSGRRFDVKVIGPPIEAANGAGPRARKPPKRRERKAGGDDGAPGDLVSPLQGTVLKVAVEKGAQVEEGALICVIEAMKMENEIIAPASGTIEELGISEGASISAGDRIAVIA